jgi:hypothetical protein
MTTVSNYPTFSIPSLESLLETAAAGSPESIDRTYLAGIVGLTPKNADLLQAGLETLGFVGPDGVLTADGRLVVSGGDGRAAAFGRALERVYAEMLAVLLENEEFNLDQVHRFLEQRTNLRLSGRQKVAAVFKYLLVNSDREDWKKRFSQKKCFA